MCRGEHEPQAEVDQVDPGEREDEVAADHDAAVDEPVDEVDQRDVIAAGDPARRHDASAVRSPTKLYGGQGPLTSRNRSPSAATYALISSATVKNGPSSPRGTRWALLSSIGSSRPLSAGSCGEL